MPSQLLADARERQRVETMRAIADVAIHLFHTRGFHEVTIESVARAAGVSPATVYRRFGTKENLVCWQPDERLALGDLLGRLRDGTDLLEAAMATVEHLPDAAIDSVAATARLRLELIAAHPALGAAARAKAADVASDVLSATEGHDRRTRLRREAEVACVLAAMDAATAAWARGDATLRQCMREALAILRPGSDRAPGRAPRTARAPR